MSFRLRVPIGRVTNMAPVCDGSEMARVRGQRSLGKILVFGGLGVALLSPSFASATNPGAAVYTALAGGAVSSVGLYVRYNASPNDAFWQSAVSQIRTGETKADEVRHCFGNPSGTMSADTEQTWTYNASKTGLFGMSGSARSLSITFRNGVVTKVQKSEFGF